MSRNNSCCTHEGALSQYFAEGETDFAQCQHCGIVLRHPMPTTEELDAIYVDLYRSDNIFQSRTNQESGSYALKQYANFLNTHIITPGARLLDYGCGTGELIELLRASGVGAIGLERSDAARRYALAQRGLELLQGINGIPCGSLDIVTMIEVIEHLTDPCTVLSEIRDCLKPGGQIFITTPNRHGFRARLEGGQWREAQKKFHVILFERESLSNLLRQCGYTQIEQIRYSPAQRPGLKGWAISRLLQLFGVSGTLCMTARATK